MSFGRYAGPVKLPPGLEPAPGNALTVAANVPTLLVIELDGGRVYLDDAGNLFTHAAHAAIRDRLVAALAATGATGGCPPLPLLHANLLARAVIAHLGRGRIVNPQTYTARDWDVPAGAD